MKNEQGLTLVEVLVALMVLAMMAGVSLQVIGRAADVRLASEERALAQLCADNLLAERMLAGGWPPTGVSEGDEPQGYSRCYWRVTVQATPLPTMRRLDIEIFANAARQRPLAQVSGFIGQGS